MVPTIDLHRHMGGSISVDTIAKIMRKNGKQMPISDIEKRCTCRERNIGFASFLDKFTILDDLTWDEEAIDISIDQVCEDISKEGLTHAEISLSINKYVKNGAKPKDVIKLIRRKFDWYSSEYNINVKLLMALRYDSPRELQQLYADAAFDSGDFIGIDLIGDEMMFSEEFYRPIVEKWLFSRAVARTHVGELPGTAAHVDAAMRIGANRIAHGIYATDDALKRAADNGIAFDLAIHSNLITGAWHDEHTHPIRRMIEKGCIVTLNTDDPARLNCTIHDEFSLVARSGILSHDARRDIINNSARLACK